MRILFVAEGRHERGREDRDRALEVFVRRLHKGITQCDLERVSRQDIHAHHGRGQGYFKRAIRWMLEAKKRGYDALVLVIDRDNAVERVQEIARAQESTLVPLRRALGVAVRTFDAWILADAQGLARVLEHPVSPHPPPEDLVEAKSLCAQLLGRSPLSMSQSEFYTAVVREADFSTIEQCCPQGFAPFARRVRCL